MIDIDSTWTENRAVWTKGSFRVFQQIKDIEETLPFRIKSYASDNVGEVLNQRIYCYFVENRPEGQRVVTYERKSIRTFPPVYTCLIRVEQR